MNEIDLYINLIDKDEADRILRIFNSSVKNSNLNFKKFKIKKILKKTSVNEKKFSRENNRFNFVIKEHIVSKNDDISEKEFLLSLNARESNNVKDYEKLANLIYHYPQSIEKYMDMLLSNYKEEKPLFDLGIEINNDEEAKNYLEHIAISNETDDVKILSLLLLKFFNCEENDKEILEMSQEIEKWSLTELRKKIAYDNNLETYTIKALYVYKHSELEEEFAKILLNDALMEFAESCKNEKKELKNKLRLMEKNSLSSEEVEELKNYKKEAESLCRKVSKLEKIIEKEKEKCEETKNKFKLNINEQKEVYQKNIVKIEKKIENLKNEKIQKEQYFNSVFNCEKDEYVFAVVTSFEIEIARKIYPEILFIKEKEFYEKKNMLRKVRKVYIQREGMSYRKIAEIEKYCNKRKIDTCVYFFGKEKNLIEKIALLKYERR